MFRFIFIFCFICLFSVLDFAQNTEHKSIEQLVDLLKGDDRKLSDLAIDELTERGEKSATLLLPIAEDKNEDQFIRVRAIIALGRIKHKNSVPILINILSEENSYIKGNAAYALSRIGGEDAKNALLKFLTNSFEKDYESLSRAVEAIKELPDKRAFPVLMKILEIAQEQKKMPENRNKEKDIVKDSTLRYAVEALGNIGDSRASVSIASFLDPEVTYDKSPDYSYLRAIYKTKGEQVVPQLISYLEATVKKLSGKQSPMISIGAENRQIINDLMNYKQIVDCLEAITGQKSLGATREDVAMFWKLYQEVHNQTIENQ